MCSSSLEKRRYHFRGKDTFRGYHRILQSSFNNEQLTLAPTDAPVLIKAADIPKLITNERHGPINQAGNYDFTKLAGRNMLSVLNDFDQKSRHIYVQFIELGTCARNRSELMRTINFMHVGSKRL
jgi:hypothetical protein